MNGLMSIRRILYAYVTEIKYESLRMLRSPGFSIPFLLLPVPVYLFFGVVLAGPAVAKQPSVADYLFSGFSVFAVMGPALFGVGCVLAIERDAGLLKLKRALPAPGGAYLVAKMTMGMVFAAAAMSTLLVAGLVAGTATSQVPDSTQARLPVRRRRRLDRNALFGRRECATQEVVEAEDK